MTNCIPHLGTPSHRFNRYRHFSFGICVNKIWLQNKREVEGTKILLLTVTLCRFVDGNLSMVPVDETALCRTSRKHD